MEIIDWKIANKKIRRCTECKEQYGLSAFRRLGEEKYSTRCRNCERNGLKCSKCHIEYFNPKKEFKKDKRRPNGYGSWCLKCCYKSDRKWRKRNIEEIRVKKKLISMRSYLKHRDETIEKFKKYYLKRKLLQAKGVI